MSGYEKLWAIFWVSLFGSIAIANSGCLILCQVSP